MKAIAELELLEKQRSELDDWINKQQAIVSDWLSRPSKLRSDGAKQELAAMNDLLTAIGDKRSQLLTEMSGPRKFSESFSLCHFVNGIIMPKIF